MTEPLALHILGRVDYLPTVEKMREFILQRTADLPDQLWICEHPSVFTQGLAGKAEHLLLPGHIPVVQTNRGGQVTYHGPGQVVAYPLLDLKRAGYFVKEYVFRLEESVVQTLAHFGITGLRVPGAPGIYTRLQDPFGHARLEAGFTAQQLESDPLYLGKIAALGIKISRHCTYHGVALNVAMDLEPYRRINPCGYAGLQTVDMASLGVEVSWTEAAQVFAQKLGRYLAA